MCVELAGIVGAVGSIAQAQAQNAAAAANAQAASLAAQRKYDDLQRKYVYNARDTQQQGYKAAMDARDSAATAVASAGSSGVGGISVSNIFAAINQIGAENEARVRTKQDDLETSYKSEVDTAEAEARGRIASVQPASGLNTGLNILSNLIPTKTT